MIYTSRFLFVLLLICFVGSPVPGQDVAEVERFGSVALNPFWKGKEISEPFFFISPNEKELPSGKFLFEPKRIVSVKSATGETEFVEGKDFVVDLEKGTIQLLENTRIPFKTQEEMYPLMTSELPKIGRQAGDKTRGIFFDNEAGYHKLQTLVTYEVDSKLWKVDSNPANSKPLPKTLAKLEAKQEIQIALNGDSISAGYNASKFGNTAPHQPAYGELVALGLQKKYGSKVTFRNYAVSGWNTTRGLQRVREEKLTDQKPDLVIIAYGMNDVFARDAATYKANIKTMIDEYRAANSDTEFVLVATMLGNVEWGMPMEQFDLYRKALLELRGPGIEVADLTTVWSELLKRKSFYDLCGNGVNHPNDFGHGVYAQVIVDLMVGQDR